MSSCQRSLKLLGCESCSQVPWVGAGIKPEERSSVSALSFFEEPTSAFPESGHDAFHVASWLFFWWPLPYHGHFKRTQEYLNNNVQSGEVTKTWTPGRAGG